MSTDPDKRGSLLANTKVAPAPSNEGNTADSPKEENKDDVKETENIHVKKEKVPDDYDDPPKRPPDKMMKNGCQKCCGKLMSCIAHDAIFGSFVGPHPVSFLCCCKLFRKQCSCIRHCGRPCSVASIATKVMNFVMLGFITLLAAFFIFPWPHTWISSNATVLSSFYPCQPNKTIRHKHKNGGCDNHAGYFMAYRCFFAFATVMLTNSFLMIRVTNTKDDPYRSKCHHGFWFYKYLYLVFLLFVYFLMVNGERDHEGVFEFVASIIGNIAHFLFSLIEIMFVLDLVELWVYENKTGNGSWANFIYWTITALLFIISFAIYVNIWVDYSSKRYYNETSFIWPEWPLDNCVDGFKRGPDWKHIGLILASTATIMFLIIVMAFRKFLKIHHRFPYTGWLQIGVMTLFNLSYLWSALTNSSNIHSRPRCNTGMDFFSDPRHKNPKFDVQAGSRDVYLTSAGSFHGLISVISLLYFAFVHGPRSSTAPLSMLYVYLFRVSDRIPVYPDENDDKMDFPLGFLEAIENGKVWDDEKVAVAQSWSMFYFVMILGSLSLMMSMTNFADPWAHNLYNSSDIAFGCKFGTAVIATFLFVSILVSKCEAINSYNLKGQRRRRRSVKDRLELAFETFEEDEERNTDFENIGESQSIGE